jgi:hypothetical protein
MWNSRGEAETIVADLGHETATAVRRPSLPAPQAPAGSCQRTWRRERVRSAEERQTLINAAAAAMNAAYYADRDILIVRLALEQALDRTGVCGVRADVSKEAHVWCYVNAECVLARVEVPGRSGHPVTPVCARRPDASLPLLLPAHTSAIRHDVRRDSMTLWLRRGAA